MKTILIIILVVAAIAGAIFVATKYFGLFSDTDKDGIPDEVENVVEDVKATAKEVKRRAKRVKEELGDVAAAAKGKPRKGRKPRTKK